MKDIDTMSAAVMKIIDGYPAGHRFHGNQLHDDVAEIYPEARKMYPDTLLRMARRHRRVSFRAVNKNNSLYEKIESASTPDQRYSNYVRELEMKKKNSEPITEVQQSGWLF